MHSAAESERKRWGGGSGLTFRDAAGQGVQFQLLGVLGQLGDLVVMLIHKVDSHSLASEEQDPQERKDSVGSPLAARIAAKYKRCMSVLTQSS